MFTLLAGVEATQPDLLLIQEIYEDYLFTMAPDATDVIRVLDDMAYRFGWRSVGLVLDIAPDTEDPLDFHIFQAKNVKYVAWENSIQW